MLVNLKKVVIVAERLLKEGIIEILHDGGSTGHTITACESEDSKGNNVSDWEGRNVQIETLVEPEAAEKILKIIGARYLQNYSIIAYSSDVTVLRSPESN